MHAVPTEVVAWAPAGYAFPSGYLAGFAQYLSDLTVSRGQGGNVTSLAAQYVDASGPALRSLANAAPIADANPYPASGCTVTGASVCLTTSQLLTELTNVMAGGAPKRPPAQLHRPAATGRGQLLGLLGHDLRDAGRLRLALDAADSIRIELMLTT